MTFQEDYTPQVATFQYNFVEAVGTFQKIQMIDVAVKKSRHEKYLFLIYFFKSRHEEHFCGSCFFKSGHGQ